MPIHQNLAVFGRRSTKQRLAGPIALIISGVLVLLFIVLCCIFYNNFTSKAATAASVNPNYGPSTGGQVVQITANEEILSRVDGLIFNNPQATGTGTTAPTQYIDTGITQTGNVKIEMKFKIADGNTCNNTNSSAGTSTMRIFGAWGSGWTNSSLYLARLSGTTNDPTAANRCAFAIRRASTAAETGASTVLPMGDNTADTNIHTWVLNSTTTAPTGSWDGADLARPTATLPSTNAVSMYLGWIHNSSGSITGNGFAGTVYHLKIWKDNVLVRDMIPVCNSSRTTCGLQDKVTKAFFGNAAGNTALAGGANLPTEIQSVAFGGALATDISELSAYAIQATTPPHAIGPVDVEAVVNGQQIIASNAYTYRPTIISVSPNKGPKSGGTGFNAAYNPNGQITITGDQFMRAPPIDPNFINTNKATWTNPTFTGYTNTSTFGGTITSTGTVYLGRNPWQLFDKDISGSNGTWMTTVSTSPSHTTTYTLPTGKYVNLSSIEMINGYYSPTKQINFFVGDNSGPSITGVFNTNSETASSYTKYNVPIISQYADVWTNQITLQIYPPAWLNTSWISLQEVTYTGYAIDLNGQIRGTYPTYFKLSDLTPIPASNVAIGSQTCTSFTVVSDSEIKCQPPAQAVGTYDVGITVDGIASTVRAPESTHSTDDDYSYIDLAIDGIEPYAGPDSGGTSVVITGNGFTQNQSSADPPTVTFDYNGAPADCEVAAATDTEITCTTSAHSAGLVNLKIDNGIESATMEIAADANGNPIMDGDKSIGGFLYYELYIGLASSLDDNKISFLVAPSDASGNSGYDIATARTNLSGGYQLSMQTDDNKLVCGGFGGCASQWYNSIPTIGALSGDSWGYQLNYLPNPLDAGQTNPAKPPPASWNPIPIADTMIYNKTSLNLGVTDAGGDKFRLWYGAKASWALPVATYERTVTITIIANI